jgi:putative ABC transport system permease protein
VQRLFGIPMAELALGLALAVGFVLALVTALALRNRVLLRLGLRNVTRRPGRAALIVTGLMLGTTIIASALVTGDTMNRTVRSAVVESLGRTDELVATRGAETAEAMVSGQGTGQVEYIREDQVPVIERALRDTGLVDGVAPAIMEPIAVQDLSSRQTEARVGLFASDAERMTGFGEIRGTDGATLSLADLGPDEVYVDRDAADVLAARPGDELQLLAGTRSEQARVAAVVDYDGAGTEDASVLVPLERGQRLLEREGEVQFVMVSNHGDEISGAAATDDVVRAATPALGELGVELEEVKQEGLEAADVVGDVFISIFTTFGSFSIAAGILLIFLIFVMLSAERRSELGIARAVGTRREHLVQMFVFEGLAYDLGAALVGCALGVAVAFGMVSVLASAFDSQGLDIQHAVSARSLVVAYALGVLLTFVVVAISAWRVSVLNIVAAVRGLPEPLGRRGGRRRVGLAIVGVAVGALMTVSGLSAAQAMPFSLGVSIVLMCLVPIARAAGVGARLAFTVAGALLLIWWLLPFETLNAIAGRQLSMDFSAWVVSGLMVVIASTWLIVYNADALLGLTMRVLGRIRALAPVLKMAMAYPLRVRFRTGVTLAMFTLVVFTIVVGATTSGAFLRAIDDPERFGGGFDVRAETPLASALNEPVPAIRAAGFDEREVPVVGNESVVGAKVRQAGPGESKSYPVRGFDTAYLTTTTYEFSALARGYDSPADIWHELTRRTDVAVVDQFAAPRRNHWGFAPPPEFQLTGFYIEDGPFDPVSVVVRDPQSGRSRVLKVIGVLSDTSPQDMPGLWTSQHAADALFGDRALPTIHHLQVGDGVDADAVARELEQAFLANGLEAKSTESVLHDTISASYTLNWLLLGFMGLGLVVGVAALGVISARSVVERRQQIGVLRSIGFRRRMVQVSFLLESSFIALTAIGVGTLLGLIISYNVVQDSADDPSWQGALAFVVPWLHLAIVFVAVYAAALLTTYAPAARASRVQPAEALRYE